VKPFRADVRCRDPAQAGRSDAGLLELAMARRRGLREDQRRSAPLWRAVDHQGEVLEAVVTKRRNKKAALKFLRKLLRRYGQPEKIVTDRLPSYRAAPRELGATDRQSSGRWLNNRAENYHLPLRRRERAMLRFRRMRSLQTFAAVHSSVYNHFNQERSLSGRDNFKLNRTAALAEWHQLGAA